MLSVKSVMPISLTFMSAVSLHHTQLLAFSQPVLLLLVCYVHEEMSNVYTSISQLMLANTSGFSPV